MIFPNELMLESKNVCLNKLSPDHAPALAQVAQEKSLWDFGPYPCSQPEIFKEKWMEKALLQMANQERFAYTIFYQGKIVGSSSYYNIEEENKKLNIGYTWLHPSFSQYQVNACIKLLMLEHALDNLQFNRVGFEVDSLNTRSCQALTKLHATYEGTLRNHLILPSGRIRHTMIYSIIREDWPSIKTLIKKRIGITCD